jgi:hypothetical protein
VIVRAGTGNSRRKGRATAFPSVGVDEQWYKGRAEVDGAEDRRALSLSLSLSLSEARAFRCPKQRIDAEPITSQPCALPARPHQS